MTTPISSATNQGSEAVKGTAGELLPCPFCGSDAACDYNDDSSQTSYWFTIGCSECCAILDAAFDSKEEAIAVWNSRAPKQGQRE